MKDQFLGYYHPTEEEFKTLWSTCTFVFDTNVLLDFYRYSEETTESLFIILEKIKDRLWIPYRVAFEYHRRLYDIIQSQANAYTETLRILNEFNNKFKEKRSHPFLSHSLHQEIDQFCMRLDGELTEKQTIVRNLILENPMKERLADLISTNVGIPLSDASLHEIYSEGKLRYSAKTPPGYSDANKKNQSDGYGDLVIWKEILIKAKTDGTNIIFVTGDVKEDWFLRVMGLTVGPQPELIQEFKKSTGCRCHIYTTDSFFSQAKEALNVEITKSSLAEISDVLRLYIDNNLFDETDAVGDEETAPGLSGNMEIQSADENDENEGATDSV